MEKKTIGIDCDEVICQLTRDLINFFNREFHFNIDYDSFHEYDEIKYYHLNEKRCWDGLVEYCKEGPKHLPLVPGAREGLIALSKKYRIVIITGRQEPVWKEATEYWVKHNLQGVPIDKFIYANDYFDDSVLSKDRPIKSLLCEKENVSIFIDDRDRYILECVSACDECILFGDYPWTNHSIKDDKVVYCKDWDALLKHLLYFSFF